MSKEELLSFVLLAFVLLVGLMGVGWYTRKRRQGSLPALPSVPADPGAVVAEFAGFYVSTTPEGQPLNRIAARGLGFRARVGLIVTESGLIVSLPSQDFWIATANIHQVTTARYTIDRVVEEGGLVLLAWSLGDEPATVTLDSYFRFEATQQVVDSVRSLLPPPSLYPEPVLTPEELQAPKELMTPDESEKP